LRAKARKRGRSAGPLDTTGLKGKRFSVGVITGKEMVGKKVQLKVTRIPRGQEGGVGGKKSAEGETDRDFTENHTFVQFLIFRGEARGGR